MADERTLTDILWVLVQVKDSICALDSTCVQAISLLEGEIIPMPNSDDVNVGIIQFRGSVLPILDLRRLLGMPSQTAERLEFGQMLEQRKQDHINWVNELRRCAQEHADFHLATDPHSCAFGRWFYGYQSASNEVSFQLKKVEDPHRKLHETALRVLASTKDGNCEEAQAILNRETDSYRTQVLRLLDETKQVFSRSYHNMIVVVSDGKTTCGLLVDEVLAVETLRPIPNGDQPSCVDAASLIPLVAQRKSDQDLVMVINQQQMLCTVAQDANAS